MAMAPRPKPADTPPKQAGTARVTAKRSLRREALLAHATRLFNRRGIGGTSLSGGVGRPADTAAAILVVAVITNVMTILDYQYPAQLLVQGLVLTGAVAFYSWRRGT